jgi:hypothetical protein
MPDYLCKMVWARDFWRFGEAGKSCAPAREECNKYHLTPVFPVSDWSIIMICVDDLLLIVSYLFAVSVFILGLRLKNKTRLNLDTRNIVSRSHSEHLWDCSKDCLTLGKETQSDGHYIKGVRKIWYLQSRFDHNFSCANWLVPDGGSVNKWYSTIKLQAWECMSQFGR